MAPNKGDLLSSPLNLPRNCECSRDCVSLPTNQVNIISFAEEMKLTFCKTCSLIFNMAVKIICIYPCCHSFMSDGCPACWDLGTSFSVKQLFDTALAFPHLTILRIQEFLRFSSMTMHLTFAPYMASGPIILN